jgi:hypothetical protein
MKRLLILLLLALFVAEAASQTTPVQCEPKWWGNPNGTGSPSVVAITLDGMAGAAWCPVPPPAGAASGVQYYREFTYGGLFKAGWSLFPPALDRIAKAQDHWAQAQVEMAAAPAKPASGTLDACVLENLNRTACVQLNTAGLAAYPVNTAASAVARCGTQVSCTALPPPPKVCTTATSGSGSVYKITNGVLGALVAGKVAPYGVPADCSTVKATKTVGTYVSTYCAYQGSAPGEGTLVTCK